MMVSITPTWLPFPSLSPVPTRLQLPWMILPSTPEDIPVIVNVLANDSDPDGDTLSISGVTQPTNGTAIIQGSSVLYTSYLNYYGPDSFTYTITDGRGGTANANVNLEVTPVNDPPVANSDTYTTTQGSSLIINPPGILAE